MSLYYLCFEPSNGLELMWKQVTVNAPPHAGAQKKMPICSANLKEESVAQRAKEFAGV